MLAKYAALTSLLSLTPAAPDFGGNPDRPVVVQIGLIRGLWNRWSDRRALAAACDRMAQTAPHLLEDIGMADDAHPPLRRRQYVPPQDRTAQNEETFAYLMAAE